MKATTYRMETGRNGEMLAKAYLLSLHYIILEQNFRAGRGEIDLIALDADEIVFVEVKTRADEIYSTAISAVDAYKMRMLRKTANAYICRHKIMKNARFDIVTVLKNRECWEVTLYKNAFYI